MQRGLAVPHNVSASRLPFQELVHASVRQQRVQEKVAFRGCTALCLLFLVLSLAGPFLGSSSKHLAEAVGRSWEKRRTAIRAGGPRPQSRQRGAVLKGPQQKVIGRGGRGKSAHSPPPRPAVSFVLLSFRHPGNVQALCEAYGCSPSGKAGSVRAASELVVVEDGGGEARQRWKAAAQASQGHTRLLESEDVHEIRAYRSGFMAAAGEVLVMLQDDDLPPAGPEDWLWPALKLFRLHPRLALISCTDGFTTAEVFGDHHGRAVPIMLEDSRLPGVPFMFVVGANSAPVLYRAAAYRAIMGFNESYSAPGEPGIGFETEVSLRLWRAGWQSAIMHCGDFQRGVGGHATLASPEKRSLRKATWAANQEQMAASFPPAERESFAETVVQLNSQPPLRPRPKKDVCRDLKARTRRRREGGGADKVSKKSAEIVKPYIARHGCR